MPKYRKKPVVIEAFRLGIDSIPDWFMNRVTTDEIILRGPGIPHWQCEYQGLRSAEIATLEGVMIAFKDDFVIQGTKGEIYPCKPDIFETIYDCVEEPAKEPVLG